MAGVEWKRMVTAPNLTFFKYNDSTRLDALRAIREKALQRRQLAQRSSDEVTVEDLTDQFNDLGWPSVSSSSNGAEHTQQALRRAKAALRHKAAERNKKAIQVKVEKGDEEQAEGDDNGHSPSPPPSPPPPLSPVLSSQSQHSHQPQESQESSSSSHRSTPPSVSSQKSPI